jgi:adenylate cyclase class 2
MNNTEIEIKVQLENATPLRALLETEGSLLYTSNQIDEYYTPAHRDFLAIRPAVEWLRLRTEGEKNSITYKHWHNDADGIGAHADEYETSIGSLVQFQQIFTALNLKKIVTVDKTRTAYAYNEYEIALDTVTGLGDFIEIEYKGNNTQTPTEIITEMLSFLGNLHVGKIYRNVTGYPFQILFPDERNFEEISA